MVMDVNYMHGMGLSTALLGIRLARDTSNVAQTGVLPLFNIVGGMVKMRLLIGTITTILGAVGNMSLEDTPTTGTMEVIAAVVAAGTYAQDDLIGLTGIPAGAMVPAATGGIPGMTTNGVPLRIGTLNQRCSASSTGQIQWTVWYIPLEPNSRMTVA